MFIITALWKVWNFFRNQWLWTTPEFQDLYSIFRWFKFTLKPPYTIMHGNLLLAIWDTSHWTSFVKFGLKTAWDILWLILKYVNLWLLQSHLSILGKIRCLQKINFFSVMEQQHFNEATGVLCGHVPRLYGGTIFGGCDTLGGQWSIKNEGSSFDTFVTA